MRFLNDMCHVWTGSLDVSFFVKIINFTSTSGVGTDTYSHNLNNYVNISGMFVLFTLQVKNKIFNRFLKSKEINSTTKTNSRFGWCSFRDFRSPRTHTDSVRMFYF